MRLWLAAVLGTQDGRAGQLCRPYRAPKAVAERAVPGRPRVLQHRGARARADVRDGDEGPGRRRPDVCLRLPALRKLVPGFSRQDHGMVEHHPRPAPETLLGQRQPLLQADVTTQRARVRKSLRLPPTAPTTAPAAAPAATPATATAAGNESDDDQQQNGADGRVDDQGDSSNPEMDVQSGQQPIADERSDDADDQVADDAKTAAVDDFSRQPAGNNPDQQD